MPSRGAYDVTKDNKKVSRIPQLRISARDYITQGFNFIVTLNEFTYGFQSVSGISVMNSVDYISEGGVNDHQIIVGVPDTSRSALTFKRGLMIRSSSIVNNIAKAAVAAIPNNMARRAAWFALNMADPQETLENGPAVGIIQVYNRQSELRAMYSFISLGITDWQIEDLDASSDSVLIESFTVAHTGITRLPTTYPFASTVAVAQNAAKDEETRKNVILREDKIKAMKERAAAAEALKKAKSEELAAWRKQRAEEKAQAAQQAAQQTEQEADEQNQEQQESSDNSQNSDSQE